MIQRTTTGTDYHVPGKEGPQRYRPPAPQVNDLDSLLSAPVTLEFRGVSTSFYRIGDLARALNRKPVTLRKLQDAGVIPRPTFFMPTKAIGGKVRLYSRKQIEVARRIALEEGILSDTTKPIKRTKFVPRLKAAWRELADEDSQE